MCASMFHELNSHSLSKHTTTATWTHAYAIPNSNVSNWLDALKAIGLTAWPKIRDVDIVGHAVDHPQLARQLVRRGITCWSQLTHHHKLMDKHSVEQVLGVPVSEGYYCDLQCAACIPNLQMVSNRVSTILNIEKAVTEMHRTLIKDEEKTDYHYHYPTDTISVFMDGLCTGLSAAGSMYLGKKS